MQMLILRLSLQIDATIATAKRVDIRVRSVILTITDSVTLVSFARN
jgi:hypothetical protein